MTRVVALAAGIAVALSSTALFGVLDGDQWVGPVLTAVAVVVVLGQLPWSRRWRPVLAPPTQLVALLLTLTGFFAAHGVARVLPGPAALGELAAGLGSAVGQIETALPPAPSTPALVLLASTGLGAAAVAVDALTFAGFGPAVCGLVLLGAYTVPTALTPDPLPWWTIAAGAVGYAAVLVADHRRRQTDRGLLAAPAEAAVPAGVRAAGSTGWAGGWLRSTWYRLRPVREVGDGVPVATALTVLSIAVALALAWAASPLIGTEGRFSGNGRGPSHGSGGEFGLNPFTALRGELNQEKPKELLRVRGLPGPGYLRAVTLTRYVPRRGWELPTRYSGVPLDRTLPSGLPRPVQEPTAVVSVENVDYRDRWLPLYGQPMGVGGVQPGRWLYDVRSTTAYTSGPVREPRWIERVGLPDPAVAALQASPSTTDVDPTYLDASGVDPRILRIAQWVTRQARTPFEQVVALNRYFLDPSFGFSYSTKTAPGSSADALLDFLTRGKRGYCEQFASAMAVMARAVGVPARVAIGFTAGTQVGNYWSISSGDAHAWVEAYFAGVGWLTFDPTPLRDGRGIQPNYVVDAPSVPIKPLPEGLAGPPPNPADPAGGSGAGGQSKPGQDLAGPGSGPGQSGEGSGAQLGGDQPARPDGGSAGGTSGDSGTSAGSGGAAGSAGSDGSDASGGQRALDLSPLGRLLLLVALIVLALVGLAAIPWLIRRGRRRRRLARARAGGAAGAVAAWREILAEFRDRGVRPKQNGTLRAAARGLASWRPLSAAGTQAIRTVVGAVERGWYARDAGVGPGADLVDAVDAVRAALAVSAPLTWSARLWPRSVLPALRRRRVGADVQPVEPKTPAGAGR